jgi:methionyl-tRNA synthetase
LVNFIGKDNIPFHAVIFPAMTMGQNQPYKLVDELPANEFYNLEGRQFSKSDGWYIDLEKFFQSYTPDQIRYAIAANAPETSDSEFTWKDFQQRCNIDLLGKFGNLVNRVLVFAKNNCASKVPPQGDLQDGDRLFLDEVRNVVDQIRSSYATFKVRRASQLIMELAQLGNVYFDGKRPWQAAKEPHLKASMETTISCCLECLKALALVAYPIMPGTAEKLWQMLGCTNIIQDLGWDGVMSHSLVTGQALREPEILFRKVENEQIEQEIANMQNMVQPEVTANPVQVKLSYEPLKDSVDITLVQQLDLRVGTVLSAEPVPKSKKLLKLQVDLGFEKRTIVSGISQYYTQEQITGKKVIVVANLKPATLMGVESQGMILAGHMGNELEVAAIQNLPNGSTVT